ncbi:MAG: hypothetical protein ABL876_13455 [Chitinophagaceae bacterium]
MIRVLRRRHRQIWMAWALLLPAGIVFAWLVIPNQPPVKLLKAESAVVLPEIVRTADKANYQVNLRSNKERTAWQLEWKNKTALTVPSAVIYRIAGVDKDISKGHIIGRIETKGLYLFSLPADSSGYKQLKLLLYDFIHEKQIEIINL